MARIIVLLLASCLWVSGYTQFSATQVSWDTEWEELGDAQYRLIFNASIEEGWHIFSQYSPEGGSQPAFFEFIETEAYQRIGPVIEPTPEAYYNDVFEVTEQIFTEKVRFEQVVEVYDLTKPIEITLYYQVCKELCISASEDFVFQIGQSSYATTEDNVVEPRDDLKSALDLKLDLKNERYLESIGAKEGSLNIWSLALLGFLGGLIALLTPCVLPIIPLTVSYFNQKKNATPWAVLYGLSIIVLYISAGLPFLFGSKADPQLFNEIASHPAVNFLLFIVLLLFALSFIFRFELNLPSSWIRITDQKSERTKGFVSVLFMALTLVLASFSCTGPILGGVLGALATQTDVGTFGVSLLVILGAFGVALALPFTLLAIFPNALSRLPKSGEWMNSVKFVLGVLELVLAFKFLSNTDLVAGWSFFKYEIIVGIWFIIGVSATLYLLIKVWNDATNRIVGALILMPVLWLAVVSGIALKDPLKGGVINTFAPPLYYTLNAEETHCPLGLECSLNFEEGLQRAQAENKPIFIDFTGYSCVNCRRMEAEVWSDPRIYSYLKEDVILVSLYVDDRTELASSLSGKYQLPDGRIKSIRTLGQYWSLFQAVNFKSISQPFYVLLNHDLTLIQEPIQFSSRSAFLAWMERALSE